METMKFHITKAHLFLWTIFFLHLSGHFEKNYTHNEMSNVFNVGLITPWDTSYPMFFLVFKFSLLFMNMHMR